MNALSSRALVRASLLLATAIAASAAHADHKLFPTDVLTSGEADVSVDLSRVEIKQDDAPHRKDTQKAGALEARVGLSERTHLSFTLQRGDIEATQDGGPRASTNATDYGIGFSHALLTEGPVLLTVSGGLTHTKASRANATTTFDGKLTAGFQFGKIRPYVSLGAEIPDEDDEGGTAYTINGGAWIPVHERVTVIPFLEVSHTDGTIAGTSSELFTLGASALVQLNERAYVRPSLAFGKGTDGGEDGKVNQASISLYYKF